MLERAARTAAAAASVRCAAPAGAALGRPRSLCCRRCSSSAPERGDAPQPEQPAGTQEGDRTTHFGFRTVREDAKEQMVRGVFDSVAEKYDLMNDAMSGGLHRIWKDRLIELLEPTPGKHYLDVAGGTGDVAFRIVDALDAAASQLQQREGRAAPASSVTISDINPSMLAVGERRYAARPPPLHTEVAVEFREGNAEELPFADRSADAYTIAFGIRNVTHIEAALRDAHRVLRRGGRLLVLEFSYVDNPAARAVYDAYSMNVIPAMGKLLANDSESYQYLVESIRRFPKPDAFADMIRQAGFRGVSFEPLTLGVVCIHSGWKL
eukprot:TRINITY_DN24079_c0_g1_i1.p1 TRINITY_DN24079_c0_g1~~TRINITY_DN24079_c0_g1_i1.p1  ORF type:complete len:346 (+),score=103.87 TRINITY_DN24079_c0_g1_i1:72-1040(+)